ncbi:MAG: aminotransferase class III-fold pyridoxal phosphate-dependent enzyme [Gammaproteobacteria bacterium]|nr:aminotransferase class III-fold pyridoxal phosphate-dependent enzyme [Gammaproteobacteria bacterium]
MKQADTKVEKGDDSLQQYISKTPASQEAFKRAARVVPGGNSRQAGYWAPYPLTIKNASGAWVTDTDGNRYIDLLNNYTALVHGHAYAPITDAVAKQIGNGTCWAAINEAQTDLAEQLTNRVSSIEQVRFTNSGTEAGILALIIARETTGRQKILMARGGYHGSLLEFESGFFGKPGPMTYLGEYGDSDSFRHQLKQHGDEIAAVFLEPVMGASGIIAASPEFLNEVKQATHEAGALFVLDEVLTFRLAEGGRQQTLGFDPDLTTFGKLIGGGFPVGAVGASRELMRIFDPADLKAFHTGTFNANPVTMVAGSASVRELTAERIEIMERQAGQLKNGLIDIARETGLALTINHVGSLLNLFFTDKQGGIHHDRDDLDIIRRFHLACLNEGLFIAPRGLMALSTVFDDALIEQCLEKAKKAMQQTAREIA